MKYIVNLVRRFLIMKKIGWGIFGVVVVFIGYVYWLIKYLIVIDYEIVLDKILVEWDGVIFV